MCNKCDDRRFVVTGRDEHGYELYSDCECKLADIQKNAFTSSKITFEFKQKNFDRFNLADLSPQIRTAYQFARTYSNQFEKIKDERNNGICILGNAGSGKTHLLMAICNRLMNERYTYNGQLKTPSVLYFPWVEGFNEMKDDLSQLELKINKMQQVDVLYIDDMWKGRKEPTSFQIEQAFAVINYRYMERKPILISSERDIDAMCDIDEALGSRINEMCKNFRVVLKGGRELNYRLREEE